MGHRTRLALASALMLFIELSLIRWLGANIVHLAYFSNFVLLGSFLGVGLGFLRASRDGLPDRPQPYYALVVLLGLIGFVSAYPVTVDRQSSQVIFFTNIGTSGPPIWLTLPGIFLSVAAICAGPAEIVGGCFRQLPRLVAYRFDLIGSLAGIVAFSLLSLIGSPPLLWFAIIAVLFIALLGRQAVGVTVALALALSVLFLYPLRHDKGDFWSPYYKVSTSAVQDNGATAYTVSVNGVPHQRLTSVAAREADEPYYLEPYHVIRRDPGRVLIVGAGTGTDVAIALAQGATHVDAVEIDPTLQRFGAQHGPDHAYQDPRVSVHIDDGRAFLQQSSAKFDLILFALPDSLTLVSGASSLRLESYLFTLQAARTARDHLAPGGAFAMYNFYREQWIVDRLAGTLADAFGHPPCVYAVPQATALAVLTVGRTPADQRCGATEWKRPADTPPPSTDDRPFVYLREPGIPGLYRGTLLMIILLSIAAIALVLVLNAVQAGAGAGARLRNQARQMWSYRDLFLLGVAFLLLETKSVTWFALLFGTTWLVNAFVFAGVLLAVLAAVELTSRLRRMPPVPVMYGLLLGALLLAWAVPPSFLLGLDEWLRAVVAVAIAVLPIFSANVIFAARFAATADAPLAFGTNLLGAILGGCLEYLSLEFGYRALLVIAAIVYVLAFLVRPREKASPEAEREPVEQRAAAQA
ncbi:MAG: spermidine synthase [Jatrophihabitantaceae bacterium]